MGNAIRLGIARIGLAINSLWTSTSKKKRGKPPVVLLVLGAQEVGKSVIASRIANQNLLEEAEAYVPTKGFSVFNVKDKGTAVRLYDLGGSEAVRELWPHYYPDAHGIIFVVDVSGRSSSIAKQAEILSDVLQDERVKRKPLLVLGNKQDIETVQVDQLITQMDLIQMVNSAKCLTRVDMTSKYKLEGLQDGLLIGFRWMINYVKWHWAELSERVEQDSFLERSQENAKFEALHAKSATVSSLSPVKVVSGDDDDMARSRSACADVESPADRCQRSAISGRSVRLEEVSGPIVDQSEDAAVLMIIPQKRLDPEGGNDVKDWIPDATHQVVLQPDTEDEFPEVVIVESRAEVHIQRARSESAVTLSSSVMSVDGVVFNPADEMHKFSADAEVGKQLATPPPAILANGVHRRALKPQTSHGMSQPAPQLGRPKLFRNKTAPVRDEPIRIPLMKADTAGSKVNPGQGQVDAVFLV